jgi:hypothetical protein
MSPAEIQKEHPRRIFVSHSEFDAELAFLIRDELLRDVPNAEVFVSSQPGAVPSGQEWLGELKRQLNAADTYLILLTAASIGRPWIWFEYGAALLSDRTALAVCGPGMQKTTVPSPFDAHQLLSLDSSPDCAQLFKELGSELRNVDTFVERASAAAKNCEAKMSHSMGWRGIVYEDRYYAWQGPLDSLADWNEVQAPLGLSEAIKSAGMMPVLEWSPDKAKELLRRAHYQVFQTTRTAGKRPVAHLLVREITEEDNRTAIRHQRLLKANAALIAEWSRLAEELRRLSQSDTRIRFNGPSPPLEADSQGMIKQYLGYDAKPIKCRSTISMTSSTSSSDFYLQLGLENEQIRVRESRGCGPTLDNFNLDLSPSGEFRWKRESYYRDRIPPDSWYETTEVANLYFREYWSGLGKWEEDQRKQELRRQLEQQRITARQCFRCGKPLGFLRRLRGYHAHTQCDRV